MKGVILIVRDKPPKDEHDIGYKDLLSKKTTFLHFLKKYIGAKNGLNKYYSFACRIVTGLRYLKA